MSFRLLLCTFSVGILSSSSVRAGEETFSAHIANVVQETGHGAIWQVGTPIDGVAAAWQAPNRARGLRTFFTESGVRVFPWSGVGGWEWGMSLAAVGRGARTEPPAPAHPSVEGNRVEYRRGSLVEWYLNDGRGLEQGFTLLVPPPGPADEPVRLLIDISGNLSAELDADRRGAELVNEAGEVVLHYTGLSVRDAAGRDLPAWLVSSMSRLAIEVKDAGAVYPLEVDPLLFTEDQRLDPSDPTPNQQFGIALGVDGDTLVVGADSAPATSLNFGAAYVFVRQGERWIEQARLAAADGEAHDFFGHAVDVSGDVIVVGAHEDDDNGFNSGSAYVFRRYGTAWTREAKLMPSDGAQADFFGKSVSVDGSTILVGSHWDDDLGLNSGSVYVFFYDGSTWTQQAKLLANDGTDGHQFGYEVCLAGDTAFIGVPFDDDSANFEGSVYVFERTGQDWTQTAELKSSGAGTDEGFGSSIDSDGLRLAAGAPFANGVENLTGAVYVFERSGGTWIETAKLVASDATYLDVLGYDVAIDGDSLLAGSSSDTNGEQDAGAAYVFRRSRSNWLEAAKLHASDPAQGAGFGFGVEVQDSTAFAGAYQHPVSGAVFVFELPFEFFTYCFGDDSGTACPCGNSSNAGAEAGCANSQGIGGSLRADGTSRTSVDDLVLLAADLVPDQPALAFAGENAVAGGSGIPFGDGLRCAGTNVVRLGTVNTGSAGESSWGPGLAVQGGWSSGDTRYFQVWYRDPLLGPCGSGFNTTNGLEVRFGG